MAQTTLQTVLQITGIQEIIDEFDKLGDAVGKFADAAIASFDKVAQAADKLGFDKIKKSIEETVSAIGNMATRIAAVFGVGLGVGVAGLVAGFIAATKSAAEFGTELSSLATIAGTTVEEMSSIVNAMAAFGASTDEIISAFRRLAVVTQSVWPEVEKEVRSAATAHAEAALAVKQAVQAHITAVLSVQQAETNAALAAINAANKEKELALQRTQNALSVKSATMSLLEAQQKLADIRGEEGPLSQFTAQELAEQKAILAVQEARQRLEEARQKQARDAAEAELKAAQAKQQAELAAQQLVTARLQEEAATLDIAKKKEEQYQKEINSIDNVTAALKEMIATGVTAQNVNLSPENIVKGLLNLTNESKDAVDSIKELGGSLGNIAAQGGPQVTKFLENLFDLVANMGDKSKAVAVLVRLFGRTLGLELFEAAQQGKAGLQAMREELEKTGLGFTEADALASRAFKRSFVDLTNTLADIKNKVFSAFAPLGTEINRALSDALKGSGTNIKGFFDDIIAQVQPFVTALANVIRGINIGDFLAQQLAAGVSPEKLKPIADAQARIEDFVEKIKGFFAKIGPAVATAFQAIAGAFTILTDVINKLTGLNLTPTETALIVIAAKVSGLTDVLGPFTSAVFGLAGAFLALAPEAALTALAITAIGVAIGAISVTTFTAFINAAKDQIKRVEDARQAAADAQQAIRDDSGKTADQIAADNKKAADSVKVTWGQIGRGLWNDFLEGARLAFQAITTGSTQSADKIKQDQKAAATVTKDSWQEVFDNANWNRFQENGVESARTIADAFKTASNDAMRSFDPLFASYQDMLNKMVEATDSALRGTVEAFNATFDAIEKKNAEVKQRLGFGQFQPGETIPLPIPRPEDADKVTDAAKAANTEIQRLKEQVKQLQDELAKAGDKAKDSFGKAGQAVKDLGKDMGSVGAVAAAADKLSAAGVDVEQVIQQEQGATAKRTEALASFARAVDDLAAALDRFSRTIGEGISKLVDQLQKMTEQIAKLADAISKVSVPKEGAGAGAGAGAGGEGAGAGAGGAGGGAGAGAGAGGVSIDFSGFTQALADVTTALNSTAEAAKSSTTQTTEFGNSLGAFKDALTNVATSVDTLNGNLDSISGNLGQFSDGLSTVAQNAPQIGSAFASIAEKLPGVSGALDSLTIAAQNAANALQQVRAPGGGGQHGGLFRGIPGIDRNYVRISDWEYIVNAEQTRKWLPVLHAINRGDNPFEFIMRKLRGFSAGGLVEGLARLIAVPGPNIPAFAGGGQVKPQNLGTINLSINGHTIGSIRGTDDTAKDLQRLSSTAKIVSAGPNPNWRR